MDLEKKIIELTKRITVLEKEVSDLWEGKEPANTDWHPSD